MFAGRSYLDAMHAARRSAASRHLAPTTVLCALAAAIIASPAQAGGQTTAPANPAHAIADKFSRSAADAPRPKHDTTNTQTAMPPPDASAPGVDELQRAYEEEMLARARAEAEARMQDDMAREQDAARHRANAEALARKALSDAEQQRSALQKAEQDRATEESRRKAEAEHLARQREAEARELAERLRAARRSREEQRARAAAQSDAQHQADARLQAARDRLYQRTQHLAGKLQELRAHHEQQAMVTEHLPTRAGDDEADPQDTLSAPPHDRQTTHDVGLTANTSRATILLIMKPGKRGIRRWNKTADPMLCIEGSCYISKGTQAAAKHISRSKGFGPGIALGSRAGACNHRLACVFRDVDLVNGSAWMQPIDLRIVRHDRREARRVSLDPTCTAQSGRLTCFRTIESKDYRAWVIPEAVAIDAGPAALDDALMRNLQADLLAGSPAR